MFQADSVTITVLVENWVDMLLPDQASPRDQTAPLDHCVTRFGLNEHFDPKLVSPQAENGISMLVEARSGRHILRVLFDVGLTGTVLRHNLQVLGVDPNSIDHIVISHGHPDHFGGIHSFLDLADHRIPVATHEDAELPRYAVLGDGRASAVYNSDFSASRVERSGGVPVLTKAPLDLGLGVYTTGEIPREVSFEAAVPPYELGVPGLYQVARDGSFRRDEVWDEMGLVIDVRDQGLVILTGCAHAGVVNTIRRAKALCPDRPIRAVMGGFHLGFPTTPRENVALTVEALQELEVQTVMPMHCSGLPAQSAFLAGMANSYVQPSVGTVLRFGGASS